MSILITTYKKNKGKKPLFSIVDIFDWYDGAMYGISKVDETNDFYLFHLISRDLPSGMRIFGITTITQLWMNKFKEAIDDQSDSDVVIHLLENYQRNYSGDIFLLKTTNLADIEYELKKTNLIKLDVYKNVEDVANQSEKERQKWFKLFI